MPLRLKFLYIHETWCQNDITAFSKNNGIVFIYKFKFLIIFSFQKIHIAPFLQLPSNLFSIPPVLLPFLYPSPNSQFRVSPFYPLNKKSGVG